MSFGETVHLVDGISMEQVVLEIPKYLGEVGIVMGQDMLGWLLRDSNSK